MIDQVPTNVVVPSPAAAESSPARRRNSPVGSAAVLVILLALSGVVRLWQDRRIDAATTAVATLAFPLKELPNQIGNWKARGDNFELDPDTVRITGCTSYVARSYADDRIGVSLTVFIAFGPAEHLFSHSPLVCFPSTGYRMEGETVDRSIPAGKTSARFRSAVFLKPGLLSDDRQEALYSFRHAGVWSPNAASTYKRFRQEPGMYKVQVERRIAPQERNDVTSPSVEFLSALLPEIEARINSANPSGRPSRASR